MIIMDIANHFGPFENILNLFEYFTLLKMLVLAKLKGIELPK